MSQFNSPDLTTTPSKNMPESASSGLQQQTQESLSPTEQIAALEAELAQYKSKATESKTRKNKREKTKAVFNVLNHVVRYYNSGETFFSRTLTIVGLGSIIASSIFGASQVPALRSQFARATQNWSIPAVLPTYPGGEAVPVSPMPATAGFSNTIEQISRPLKASPTAPQVAPARSPASPISKPAIPISITQVEREVEQVIEREIEAEIKQIPIAPPIEQTVNEVEREIEQVIPESLPIQPPTVPAVPAGVPDLPFNVGDDDAQDEGDD
jgi:hypothetical protein